MNLNNVLCSSCKKRYAIYKRKSSGEFLCKLCLFRSLVKQTRKAVNNYHMISRKQSMLYIIRPDAVGESVEGLVIYRSAVKDLEAKIYALCINNLTLCEDVEQMLLGKIETCLKTNANYIPSNKIEMIKLVEALAVSIAKKHGIELIVSPLFRDESTIFSLIGMLTVSTSILSEGLPIKTVSGIKIIRPFFYVMSIDVSILRITDKIDLEPQISIACDDIVNKAKATLYSSIELMYSSIKSIEIIQSKVFNSLNKCRYCGAYSSNEVCEICRKFYHCID